MEKLRSYLLDNENLEELIDAVRELNSWDGCLEHLDAHDNDEEFFELIDISGLELANKIYYGNYNPNDDYVRFDAYENLESLSKWEYGEELKDNIEEIMENLLEYKYALSLYNGLDEILDEILQEMEEEIEE